MLMVGLWPGGHASVQGDPSSALLDALPDARFRDVTWPLRELMIEKSEEELVVLRHCGRIGELACQAMLDAVKPQALAWRLGDVGPFQAIVCITRGGIGAPAE